MNDFSQARDIVAALLIMGAVIALILGVSPLQPWFLVTAVLLFLGGSFVAKHRVAAISAAVGALGFRFLFVFAMGKDWRMLAGALVCGGLVYCAVKLNPSLLESGDY